MAIDPREISLTADQKRQLAELADRLGLPWSEVIAEAIASYQASSATERVAPEGETFYDAMRDVIGIVKDAPPDLSTNPKHLEGFGCDYNDRAD